MKELVDQLYENHSLSKEEFYQLLTNRTRETEGYARELANKIRKEQFGDDIYIRGLIEFTNYCKNDCFYCGIRRSNPKANRYRLTKEQIMDCCKAGYELGFRTFVLQGGEDPYFRQSRFVPLIETIKKTYPDCALTLSLGEKSLEEYQAYRTAGADRYLLRHETADEEHYHTLHPAEMSLTNRMNCLRNLKKLGFQTGAGFMVGAPGQTMDTLTKDFLFLKELDPQMVGIGPFISHKDTPFREKANGTLEDTLFYLALLRLLLPKVLLPATTALGTIHPEGRELGILSGANVVMPNLSPQSVRKKYLLYDDKICTGEEAAEGLTQLKKKLEKIGCHIVMSRGDYGGSKNV